MCYFLVSFVNYSLLCICLVVCNCPLRYTCLDVVFVSVLLQICCTTTLQFVYCLLFYCLYTCLFFVFCLLCTNGIVVIHVFLLLYQGTIVRVLSSGVHLSYCFLLYNGIVAHILSSVLLYNRIIVHIFFYPDVHLATLFSLCTIICCSPV